MLNFSQLPVFTSIYLSSLSVNDLFIVYCAHKRDFPEIKLHCIIKQENTIIIMFVVWCLVLGRQHTISILTQIHCYLVGQPKIRTAKVFYNRRRRSIKILANGGKWITYFQKICGLWKNDNRSRSLLYLWSKDSRRASHFLK